MTLSVYSLAYRMPSYFKESVESIVKNSTEPLRMIVVDSKSNRSPEIAEIAKGFLKEGKIQIFLQASMNCKGYGIWEAYKRYPPDEDWFVISDLDVAIRQPFAWNERLREKIKDNDLVGFSLDESNYVPPNGGHDNIGFGYWLTAVKVSLIKDKFPKEKNIIDSDLRTAAKKWCKLPDKLYHLSWNLWQDDPDYFSDKQKGIDWMKPPWGCEYVEYK